MTAAQARAVAAGIRLYPATAADREAGAAALADVGYAFAPRVDSSDGGERIFFDCADLGQLYPYGETRDRASGPGARGAPGAGGARRDRVVEGDRARGDARARAGGGPGGRGRRAGFPGAASRRAIDRRRELRAAFRRWGTRTAGAIAALPADAVALRLVPRGADVARLACGKDDEPFVPRLPPDALEEAVELDYPVYGSKRSRRPPRPASIARSARLAGRSLACAGMALRLSLDPRGLDMRTVSLAAPTREAKTLLELVRLDLARRPPDAAVVGARIIVEPARVRATQLDMLRPAGPAPNRLATTLARLAALVGPENVGAPAAIDSWREQAVAVIPYVPPPGAACRRGGGRPGGHAAHGPAQAAAGGDRSHHGPRRPPALRGSETTARVLVTAGPYRLSGEWWQPPAATAGNRRHERRRARRLGSRILGRARIGRRRLSPAPRRPRRPLLPRRLLRLARAKRGTLKTASQNPPLSPH